MSRKSKWHLLVISLVVMLLLSIIFPNHRNNPDEHRYLFGFPDTFLTIYGREFFLNMGIEYMYMPPIHRRILVHLLQFLVNVLVVYFCLRVSIFICKHIFNKLKKHYAKDAPSGLP